MQRYQFLRTVCGSVIAMLAGTTTLAAPMNSSANNCTFVDAVVSESAIYGTGRAKDTQEQVAVGRDGAAAEPVARVRLPAGAANGLKHCGVVHFSTAVDEVGGTGNVRATTQKFLRMATIFSQPDADEIDMEAIFEFVMTAPDTE